MKNNLLKKYLLPACILMITVFSPVNLYAQRPELIIPATHEANSVVISPDDKWVVSAGKDGIKVWDNKTGSLLKNLTPGGKNNKRFDEGKVAMTINAGSTTLAMQFADSIFLFDFDKFIITKKIAAVGYRTAMVFSAEGKILYATGRRVEDNGSLIIERINCATGRNELLKNIAVKPDDYVYVKRLDISPDGKTLLLSDPKNTSRCCRKLYN